MGPTETVSALGGLPEGRFNGAAEFSALVRTALVQAAEEGWAEMVWSDLDFADWPLRERAVVQSLQAWARPGRRLVLLARSFAAMPRCHPLFVDWRIRCDHLIECRKCSAFEGGDMPSALLGPTWGLRRLDLVHSSGLSSAEPRWRAELRGLQQACQRQSTPGFPASILGL